MREQPAGQRRARRRFPLSLRCARAWLYAAVPLILTGCSWDLLNPSGSIGVQTRNLIVLATALMLLVVIPVIILTLVFAWRYRETNTRAEYAPRWSHSTRPRPTTRTTPRGTPPSPTSPRSPRRRWPSCARSLRRCSRIAAALRRVERSRTAASSTSAARSNAKDRNTEHTGHTETELSLQETPTSRLDARGEAGFKRRGIPSKVKD